MTGFTAYGIGLFEQNWGTNGMIVANFNQCNNCGTVGNNIHITGTLTDYGGGYASVLVDTGGTLIASSTQSPAATAGNSAYACSNGTLDLYHNYIGRGSPASTAIGLQVLNYSGPNCTVHARSTLFNGGSSGAAVQVTSGTLDLYLDDNGNTFSTPNFVISGTLRVHQKQAGTCVFAAATTCVVTFAPQFGNSTLPAFVITPVNPGAITFTVTSLSGTSATITGSGTNSLSVSWEATLN